MNKSLDDAALEYLRAVDEKERLLLQAAILPPASARRAWEQFCALTPDIERAAESSFSYFPAVAGRLAENQPRIEQVSRLQSVLRHSWARRQFVLSRLLPLFQRLNEKKIAFILLKGLAISFSYQPYRGERGSIDVGMLVAPAHLQTALSLLHEAGWQISSNRTPPSIGSGVSRPTEICLSHPAGESLTVQPRLFSGSVPQAAESSLWKKARDSGFPGMPLRILDPFHQFLHICFLASPSNSALNLNPGLVDAAHFLTPTFPWRRLELVAHRFCVVSSVRRVVLALAEAGLNLPAEVVCQWRKLRIEATDEEVMWARLKKLESLPPLRRYLSRERTRRLASLYIESGAPAGFFAFWSGACIYARREHHLRAYNRRVYFYMLILRDYVTKRRT